MLLATLLSLGLAPQLGADGLAPRPRLRARDPFPNVELVRHDGETVRFQDDLMEGKVFILNFMYTSCADVCPMETARLSEVQAILGDRVGEDVHMYSITVDPDRDTPEILADYRERFGVEEGLERVEALLPLLARLRLLDRGIGQRILIAQKLVGVREHELHHEPITGLDLRYVPDDRLQSRDRRCQQRCEPHGSSDLKHGAAQYSGAM